jgi:hypothetical protein
MATHCFNTEIASDLGVNGAVFIQNLAFWIEQNSANHRHFYEGTYWTYNTAEALLRLFPYFSKDQLRTVIQKAIDKGYMKKGNFNKSSYDRTLWYSLTEKATKYYPEITKNFEQISDVSLEEEKGLESSNDAPQFELGKIPNGNGAYPNYLKETNINTNINLLKIKNKKEKNEKKDDRQEYVSLKNKTPIYQDLTKEPDPHPHDTPEIREKHFKKLGIATNNYDINNKNINPIAELQSLKKMLRLNQHKGT